VRRIAATAHAPLRRRALQKYIEGPALRSGLIQGLPAAGRPSSKFTWVTRAFITAPSPKAQPRGRGPCRPSRSPAFRSTHSERSSRQFRENV